MAGIARKTRWYPSDLTNAEWERIALIIARPPPRGRKPGMDFRESLKAIRRLARSARGLAHVAERVRPLANDIPVTPPVRSPPAVPDHSRRGAQICRE